MFDLATRSAFNGIAVPGRYGREGAEIGVFVSEREGLGLATIEARKGARQALCETIQNAYGIELPDGPNLARGNKLQLIGTGRDQWLAVSQGLQNETLTDDLAGTLKGFASISDQSSGRAVLRLHGPNIRDCLAKGLAIDLDPRVFADGAAAISPIAHMGALIWRDDLDYNVVLFRSFAASFWHWLETAAAEYGLEVVTTS